MVGIDAGEQATETDVIVAVGGGGVPPPLPPPPQPDTTVIVAKVNRVARRHPIRAGNGIDPITIISEHLYLELVGSIRLF